MFIVEVRHTDILLVGPPMGVQSGTTNVALATDLQGTRALYDFDGIVVDMNWVLNRGGIIPPSSFIEQKKSEAEHLLAKGE